MHNGVGDGPQRPENDAPASGPQLTPPTADCLSQEEREALGQAVRGVLEAIKTGSVPVFEMAMDKFVDLGAHIVGHGLNGMLWSSFQAKLVSSGQPPADHPEVMITMEPNDTGNLTEQGMLILQMVTEFMRGTFGGAHGAAIDAWANWVDAVGDDWDTYTTGVASVMSQVFFLATAEAGPGGEMGDAVMGTESMKFAPGSEQES